MAALGSALSTQLRAPSAQWKAKAKRATKARCAPVRAASTENKIEDVAAAVDPQALLPEGLYCESHYKAIRRPPRSAATSRLVYGHPCSDSFEQAGLGTPWQRFVRAGLV